MCFPWYLHPTAFPQRHSSQTHYNGLAAGRSMVLLRASSADERILLFCHAQYVEVAAEPGCYAEYVETAAEPGCHAEYVEITAEPGGSEDVLSVLPGAT